MKLFVQILTLYSWGAVCVLLFFLFGIAQFFEQRLSETNSERNRQRYYPYFIAPIVLFALSTILYIFSDQVLVGNLWADLLRIIGSGVFAYAGYSLLNTMLGGKS